jgi:phospholipid/cholesterol/gamma-HCH transport system substrate-binding protein
MRRLAFIVAACLLAAGWAIAAVAGADDERSYEVELDNAFGLVEGSLVRIAGVDAGTITGVDVNDRKRAVVAIEVSGPFAQLHADAHCSSEPQSLIAEYFLDCQPGDATELLPDGGLVPVGHTFVTVQNDLLFNTLREPFRQRFALIINEFGTGLAGNPESLNAAIRRGVPALRQLRRAFAEIAAERTTIRDLTSDAERIVSRLADRREDVSSFVTEAGDTAVASDERRDDLARDLELLPGFLAELEPSMDRLRVAAEAGTPLLSDLHAAAGDLTNLTEALPAFAGPGLPALQALGASAVVGRDVLTGIDDELTILRRSARRAPRLTRNLAAFVRDLDDPDRAVEVDARAHELSGRPAPTGFTGFEGLLNTAYYLTTASNQYDQIGHLTQFWPTEFLLNPCTLFNAGPTVPSSASTGFPPYGTTVETRSAAKRHSCVAWLGPTQPGINYNVHLPPYDPSVCPDGSLAPSLCNPSGGRTTVTARGDGEASSGLAAGPATEGPAQPATPGETRGPEVPGGPETPAQAPGALDGVLDILGIGGGELDHLLGPGRSGPRPGAGTGDLLNFLFAD